MKDFYDIYYLAKNYNFDSLVLRNAMATTFKVRETKFEIDSVNSINRLKSNQQVMNRWDNFSKKILAYQLTFEEVVDLIIVFLDYPFQSMLNEKNLNCLWKSDQLKYCKENDNQKNKKD